MKSLAIKTLRVLCAYYFVIFLQACCSCLPVLDYFDYSSISSEVNNNFISQSEQFVLTVGVETGGYLATSDFSFLNIINPISSTYACSCADDGHSGEKYIITELNIFADSVFVLGIEANRPLNSLFKYESYYVGYDEKHYPIGYAELVLEDFDSRIDLQTNVKPISSREYTFTIQLIKENRDTLYASTEAVAWAIEN